MTPSPAPGGTGDPSGKAPVELIRALAVLAEPPESTHGAVARALGLPEPVDAAGHADLFLFQLHPWASVHLGPEGMLGGEARARIAGFWRAVGRTPPADPDHLAALLGLWASLLEEAEEAGAGGGEAAVESGEAMAARGASAAHSALARESAGALFREHLLPWLPPFLDRVEELGAAFHRAWARLLRRTLVRGAEALPRGAGPARHLAEAPPLPDPRREGAEAFVSGLLAPVRSGLVLARHDLALVARSVGLGVRAGERRYALEHLLGLDPVAVLGALAGLAEARERSHRSWPGALEPVRGFWSERARRTAGLLRALAADQAAPSPPAPEAATGGGAR